MLEKLDMSKKLTKAKYTQELGPLQVRLRELEFQLYKKDVPVLCVFEGWDAAGKGGVIKRLTEMLDPRGYSVSAFAAPRGDERTHVYLWRFWRNLPRAGVIGVWDRSHYGRVLVERVEGFCTYDEWRRAYHEINEFEAHQTSFGMVICKFWLHITQQEQLRRFKARELDPFRSYKLTEEDWRNRAKWPEYSAAVEDMLLHCSTNYAPWTVVEANDKYHARVKVLRTVVERIEQKIKNKAA
jgi:polyphosphate kinase 2 (PPK2 family)